MYMGTGDQFQPGPDINLTRLRKRILKVSRKTDTNKDDDCLLNTSEIYKTLEIEFARALKKLSSGSESPDMERVIPDPAMGGAGTGNTMVSCCGETEGVPENISVDLNSKSTGVSYADSDGCHSEDIDPKWDNEQAEIITRPSNERLLVDAGPGTGKTDVACARVAWLVNRGGVSPGRIWLISFTHAAVHEIRNRIASHLDNPDDLFSITIATLDSQAWAIHSGFDREARLTGSYEENITKTLEKIQNDEEIWEYLESLEHIIIDEAQDIVGIRADLILEIFNKICSDCGVTVFTDDAQAIYGFSIERERPVDTNESLTLSDSIQQNSDSLKFKTCSLSRVYRTGSPELLRIFSGTRKCVLEKSIAPDEKLQKVIEDIKVNSGKTENILSRSPGEYRDNSFILYRTRAEVLLASAFLKTTPHRIRISGLPSWIAPWVGACLSNFDSSLLTREDFTDLWDRYVEGRVVLAPERKAAWEELVHLAGESHSTVDMRRVRMKLGQRRPPRQFCFPEFGHHGPIIGTIHASKGRETGEVRLLLPPDLQKRADQDEETRVYFVGATRARDRLYVGRSYKSLNSKTIGSKRIVRYPNNTGKNTGKIQMQVGCDGDIDPESVAGRNNFPNSGDPEKIQETLLTWAGRDDITWLKADLQDGEKEKYLLNMSSDGTALGFLSQRFMDDIKTVAREIYKNRGRIKFVNVPRKFDHIRLFGVRTIVLPPESSECDGLFEPWSASGIMLAPVILGFSTVYYRV